MLWARWHRVDLHDPLGGGARQLPPGRLWNLFSNNAAGSVGAIRAYCCSRARRCSTSSHNATKSRPTQLIRTTVTAEAWLTRRGRYRTSKRMSKLKINPTAAALINRQSELSTIIFIALVGGTGVVIVFGLLLLGISRSRTATKATTRYRLYVLSGLRGNLVVAVAGYSASTQ